jgi:hypothetical protein
VSRGSAARDFTPGQASQRRGTDKGDDHPSNGRGSGAPEWASQTLKEQFRGERQVLKRAWREARALAKVDQVDEPASPDLG